MFLSSKRVPSEFAMALSFLAKGLRAPFCCIAVALRPPQKNFINLLYLALNYEIRLRLETIFHASIRATLDISSIGEGAKTGRSAKEQVISVPVVFSNLELHASKSVSFLCSIVSRCNRSLDGREDLESEAVDKLLSGPIDVGEGTGV